MKKPIVAIVGRTNVGKSTLFNRIVGKRLAIVEDTPGLTRDRLYGDAKWRDKEFFIVDTGGFEITSDRGIINDVKKQTLIAMQEADIVLMLFNAESGITPIDIELVNIIRRYDKKIFYAVNKVDGPKKEKALYDFYSLGVDLFPLSALNGYGFDELMDSIASGMPEKREGAEVEYPRIAILGRPNVGKSTLVNSLLGKERMIVSPVPGTTRDAVDSICSYNKKKYILIDTAGIRKKGKMAGTFERYSFIRTLQNIESCDVALVMLDSTEGIVEMDQKIAGLVHERKKGTVIVLNKWDITEKTSHLLKKLKDEIQQKLWFIYYAPILTISALNRQRIVKLFPLIDEIILQSSKWLSASELNNFLLESLSIQHPPQYKGKTVKIHYITQSGIKPPTFLIFTNIPEGIKQDYLRFLERELRKRFPFKAVPVRFYVKGKR